MQAAQHEVDVLSLLSHRNIVGYYNNYVDSEVMYIEMEYANGGTLSHLIGLQQQPFPEVICGYGVITIIPQPRGTTYETSNYLITPFHIIF